VAVDFLSIQCCSIIARCWRETRTSRRDRTLRGRGARGKKRRPKRFRGRRGRRVQGEHDHRRARLERARVIPVASIEEAASAETNFRIGERGSAKVAGFDFGNSPTEILASEIPSDSTVALSTTNGPRVAEDLSDGTHDDTGDVVVGCGWEGHRASEDEAAAGAILHRLGSRGADLDERAGRIVERCIVERYLSRSANVLKSNSAARRLKRLGYVRDLDFCLAEDTVPVVSRLVGGAFVG
jgi:2-phosphosulfolactate phosphatase